MTDAPLLVTLRLTAKDGAALQRFLRKILPATRAADGCRSCVTYLSPDDPFAFVLVQEWDSLEQQQAYMHWREESGVLAEFIAHLSEPPVVELWRRDDSI